MAFQTDEDTKTAVLALLAAAAGLAGVDVRYQPPTEGEDIPPGMELVYLGDTEYVDDDWDGLGRDQGRGTRKETFRLAITVWVAQYGDDPQPVSQRATVLWQAIEDTLRTDLFSQPSTIRAAGPYSFGQITGTRSVGVLTPNVWGVRIDGRVTFVAKTT